MQSFLDPEAPLVQIGDLNHVIYLAGIFVILFMLFKFRYQIKENPKRAMLGILIFAIVQRIISGSYYILADEFTVTDSLPLHICRVVCYLIIIQYFAEQKWLDQIIFYFGLFAYASFIYPGRYFTGTSYAGSVIFHAAQLNNRLSAYQVFYEGICAFIKRCTSVGGFICSLFNQHAAVE
jgi:Integral membrane protein (intg_mem_TP0381).